MDQDAVTKYAILMGDFYNKWSPYLNSEIKKNLSEIITVVERIKDTKDMSSLVRSVHRAISLLKTFLELYSKELDQIIILNFQCESNLLHDMTPNAQCNQESVRKLNKLIADYKQFAVDLIGCGKNTSKTLLSVAETMSTSIDPYFQNELYQIYHGCGNIKVQLLRQH